MVTTPNPVGGDTAVPGTWSRSPTSTVGPVAVPLDGGGRNPPVASERAPRRRPPSRAIPGRRLVPWAVPVILGVAAFGARLAFAATGPTDWDSAQYAAAVSHFDVAHGEPQPPGYWLYVETGRLVSHVAGIGTITALVLVAATASALAVAVVAVAGRDLGGPWMGTAAGILVATSPFAWYSGAQVATYSFDLLGGSLLCLLTWRAHPGSRHGIMAVGALALLAGFRQSMALEFALVVLLALVASIRSWRHAAAAVVAGAAGTAVWLVPMSLAQPGGFTTWLRATRIEAQGAATQTSILEHAPGAATNLGTFAAYTVVALGPLALLAGIAGTIVLVRRGRPWRRGDPVRPEGWRSTLQTVDRATAKGWDRARPWYLSKVVVLLAAAIPAMAVVALVQFAKGGYLLAYLPATTLLVLVPVATITRTDHPAKGHRHATPASRRSRLWYPLATAAVVAIAALGTERFVSGAAVLPARWARVTTGPWIVQARYQAPYDDTAHHIEAVDAIDRGFAALKPRIDARRDVVVIDDLDGGQNTYRNAGWELPGIRIALIGTDQYLYNELHGSLFYEHGTTIQVAPGGSALLVASPALPGLAGLVDSGAAVPVSLPRPIGGFLAWRVRPGAAILGVPVVARAGRRPLGTGI